MGYSPWGCKESDTSEQLTLSHFKELEGMATIFLNMVFPLAKL